MPIELGSTFVVAVRSVAWSPKSKAALFYVGFENEIGGVELAIPIPFRKSGTA